MKETKIIKNQIKCLQCGDVIESISVHDYKTCKCGACAVDGGREYLRRTGNIRDWEELSELSELTDNNLEKSDEEEKEQALQQLMHELDKGEKSILEKGTVSFEDIKKKLGI
jgi:CHAD domain-containing protein